MSTIALMVHDLSYSLYLLNLSGADQFMLVLPACSKDQFVLDLLKGQHPYPLDTCDPKCVSNKNFPNQTWFGDDMPWKANVTKAWRSRGGVRLSL